LSITPSACSTSNDTSRSHARLPSPFFPHPPHRLPVLLAPRPHATTTTTTMMCATSNSCNQGRINRRAEGLHPQTHRSDRPTELSKTCTVLKFILLNLFVSCMFIRRVGECTKVRISRPKIKQKSGERHCPLRKFLLKWGGEDTHTPPTNSRAPGPQVLMRLWL